MDYKPNSHRYKEEKPQIKKVAKGKVTLKKKNKLVSSLLSEDIGNVTDSIVNDTIIPAIKKAVYDMITDGISMMLYGELSNKKKSGTYVSYRDYSDSRTSKRRTTSSFKRFDLDEIVFSDCRSAEEVLNQMDDVIDYYGFVTVADLYDMVDQVGPFTSNNYGWKNLRDAEIVHNRDGYRLKLQRPVPIDN